MAKYPTRRRIFDLAGEAHSNRDGSSRQAVLKLCNPGDPVALVREPDNPHDANAVLVTAGGAGIGYLSRADAAELASALDDGRKFTASIHELTGGLPDYPNFGCRICITWDGQQPKECRPLQPEQSLYGRREVRQVERIVRRPEIDDSTDKNATGRDDGGFGASERYFVLILLAVIAVALLLR